MIISTDAIKKVPSTIEDTPIISYDIKLPLINKRTLHTKPLRSLKEASSDD